MRARRLVVPFVGLLVAAAACGPASYPDQPAVLAAQAGWCQALAKVNGAGVDVSTCKGATPTGSAAYVRGMSKCLPARKEVGGDKAWDLGLMVAECKQEVVAKTTIDEAAVREVVDARCARAARCETEKPNAAECVAAAKKIDTFQRSLLYGIYNGAALHEIASCLESSACAPDEYATQDACYKQVSEKLVWLPH